MTLFREIAPWLIASLALIVAPVVWWKVEDWCVRRRRSRVMVRNDKLTKVSGGGSGWRRS